MVGLLCSKAGLSEPITTKRIESFPKEPVGYQLIDWRQRSSDYVRFVLNPSEQGEYLPLMWWDDSQIEGRKTTFGLPSYVGMKGQWNVFRNAHEAFVTMGTLASGTWLGMDMSAYPVPGSPAPVNLVSMQAEYFSNKNQVFSDLISGDEPTGQTFFYEVAPSLLLAPLCDRYRQETALADKWRRSCQRWAEVGGHLWRLNDYAFQSYDLQQKQAVTKDWIEPDVAAGLAYLMLMAYQRWPEEQRFYEECHHALMWMDKHPSNLNYSIFAPFGVYAAARANAEHGSKYDVAKFFSWCFETSAVRGISPHATSLEDGDDYGIIGSRFGEVDVAGLVGASRIELLSNSQERKGKGHYVFAMETFAQAWPLVAAVRYDERLARATGKWMYHAAHSARYFYPDQLPPEMQTNWDWAKKHSLALPYEGLKDRNCDTGKAGPYGCGDATIHDWGPSNLGLYSGCLSGAFGAIIERTSAPEVLSLNLNATDTFAPKSFPTRLIYNPGRETASVDLKIESGEYRAWDTVRDLILSDQVKDGKLRVEIPADEAVVVVLIPIGKKLTKSNGRLVAEDIIVDYHVQR
ncbi:MAG: hypothetical protein ACKO81_04020 [Planctomycetota bacterium]